MSSIPAAIDLATTYSAIAIFRNGHAEIVPVDGNERSLPSVVCFEDGNPKPSVGRTAKDSILGQKIYDSKRLIGRRFDDPAIQGDFKNWPFRVVNDRDRPKFEVRTSEGVRLYAPEEISAMILMELKKKAEEYSGQKVDKVVITVPSYFNDQQRSATKDAARIAGLEVLRMINEPTAAAMAYGLDKINDGKERKLLIADVGGGTSDFTVLVLDSGVFEVKSTCGDSHLGGQDLDNGIVEFMIDEFKRKEKIDLRPILAKRDNVSNRALNKMKKEAEKIKIALSASQQHPIFIESLYDGKDLNTSITRAMFEEKNRWFFDKCLKCIDQALKDSDLSKTEIDEIVLVGGTTRIPKFQEVVSRYFNGKSLCKSVNPDEAIALGAAIQASILMKDESAPKELLLIDVCPLSLGVAEGMMGRMQVIIPRNTTIPTEKELSFTTSSGNQSQALIEIYEGERAQARDNKKLGEFMLSGLESSSAKVGNGLTLVAVKFNLDSNGVLSVTASSGNITKNFVIKDRTRYTSEEIEEMMRKASEYRQQDEEFTRKTTALNQLQSQVSLLPEDKKEPFQNWIHSSGVGASLDEIESKEREVKEILSNTSTSGETPSGETPSSGPVITEVD